MGVAVINVVDEQAHARREFRCDIKMLLAHMKLLAADMGDVPGHDVEVSTSNLSADTSLSVDLLADETRLFGASAGHTAAVHVKPHASDFPFLCTVSASLLLVLVLQITVKCDISTFAWLMAYVKAESRGQQPETTLSNCVQLVLASHYLQVNIQTIVGMQQVVPVGTPCKQSLQHVSRAGSNLSYSATAAVITFQALPGNSTQQHENGCQLQPDAPKITALTVSCCCHCRCHLC